MTETRISPGELAYNAAYGLPPYPSPPYGDPQGFDPLAPPRHDRDAWAAATMPPTHTGGGGAYQADHGGGMPQAAGWASGQAPAWGPSQPGRYQTGVTGGASLPYGNPISPPYGISPYGGAATGTDPVIPQAQPAAGYPLGDQQTGGYSSAQQAHPSGAYPSGAYPSGEHAAQLNLYGQQAANANAYAAPSGQYPAAQYPAAQYPAAQYPSGQYQAAQYPSGQYQAGQYQAAQYPAAQYPSGQYQAAQYPSGQYPSGQYQAAQYPSGQYQAPAQAASGQYASYPSGQYPVQAFSGQYPAEPSLYGTSAQGQYAVAPSSGQYPAAPYAAPAAPSGQYPALPQPAPVQGSGQYPSQLDQYSGQLDQALVQSGPYPAIQAPSAALSTSGQYLVPAWATSSELVPALPGRAELESPTGQHERVRRGKSSRVDARIETARIAADEDAQFLDALKSIFRLPSLFPRMIFVALGFTAIGPLALAYVEALPLPVSARLILLPAALVVIALGMRYREWGRRALIGWVAGIIATMVYDCLRLGLVQVGIWGDPIPGIGRLLLDDPDANWIWGYAWRFMGNGGGMAIAFTMLPWRGVRAGIVYGTMICTGLIAVLGFWPVAQEHFFPLTPITAAGGYAGHWVYGGVLGWITSRYLPQVRKTRSASDGGYRPAHASA